MIRFTVEGPPVPKARARVYQDQRGAVHAVTPKRTRDYEGAVARACLVATRAHNLYGPLVPVVLRVAVFEGRKQRAADLDNYVKSASDAIKGIAFLDDRQVERLYAEITRGAEAPRMVIEVQSIEEANARDPWLIK